MKGNYEEAICKKELWEQYLYLHFFISVLPMAFDDLFKKFM